MPDRTRNVDPKMRPGSIARCHLPESWTCSSENWRNRKRKEKKKIEKDTGKSFVHATWCVSNDDTESDSDNNDDDNDNNDDDSDSVQFNQWRQRLAEFVAEKELLPLGTLAVRNKHSRGLQKLHRLLPLPPEVLPAKDEAGSVESDGDMAFGLANSSSPMLYFHQQSHLRPCWMQTIAALTSLDTIVW